MNSLARDLDAEIEKRSLLKHSFYKMWSEGTLSREHLAGYSQEYFQLVRTVPDLVRNIARFVKDPTARTIISGIRDEETQHIELWTKFAGSLGVPKELLTAYRGTPKTKRALSRLRTITQSSFCEGAAAMYAIESEQPKISRTKLDGLKAFYGMNGDDDSTSYFREHEAADVRHAAVWSGFLERETARGVETASLEATALSSGVQNTILDSVMETWVNPSLP